MLLLPKGSWKVKKTKLKGRGLFAAEKIEVGTVIGDYLGEIIDDKELNKRDGLYAYWRSEKESIWPIPGSIGIHLLNHSCMPNCAVHPYKGHMLYYAIRTIFPGEELTVQYFLSPPDQDEEENFPPQVCYCGTPLCRATMYATGDFLERFYDAFFSTPEKEKYLKPIVKYGEQLPKLDRYPTSLKDQPLYDLFGSLDARPLTLQETKLPKVKEMRALIRESGRQLNFKKLDLKVMGVQNGKVVIEKR